VDVGKRLLDRFTGKSWEEIDRDYRNGSIGSREAYTRIAPLFRGARTAMLAYVLDMAALDRDYVRFYRLCRQNGVDVRIVSDGLDFYIEALLIAHGLAEVEYFSNRAVFNGESISFEFPGASGECGRCGNCKRAILNGYRPAYDRILYIGDGHSDVCPAKDADLVFAKTILYQKIADNGRSCIHFETFNDIIKSLRRQGILRSIAEVYRKDRVL
jgi:2,3-diketo-5-methylthio-1-phosphopentane phosphatase